MNKKTKGLTTVSIIILVLIALGMFLSLKKLTGTTRQTQITRTSSIATPTVSTPELTTFKSSSVMKFSVDIPIKFKAEEKSGSITLISGDDMISITQNGTNFDNLSDYLKNSRNNLRSRITNQSHLIINGLEGISGMIENEKLYLIYSENRVYFISTKSLSLYDDLDQIAQSFRYTP